MPKRKKKPPASKYRGVGWHKAANRWLGNCRDPNGKLHSVYRRTEYEAAKAYDEMANKYHKGNAIYNFPEDWKRKP